MDIRCILSPYLGFKTERSSLIRVVDYGIPVQYATVVVEYRVTMLNILCRLCGGLVLHYSHRVLVDCQRLPSPGPSPSPGLQSSFSIFVDNSCMPTCTNHNPWVLFMSCPCDRVSRCATVTVVVLLIVLTTSQHIRARRREALDHPLCSYKPS